MSDGTCSGDTAGNEPRARRSGSPVIPNADASSPRRRRPRADRRGAPAAAAAACRRCRPPSTTAATSRPAPTAPSSVAADGWVGEVHRRADDRCRRRPSQPCRARGAAPRRPRRRAAVTSAGDDDRDQADEHPEPGTGCTVGPRIAAGRAIAPSPARSDGDDDGRHGHEAEQPFGEGTSRHAGPSSPSSLARHGGPPCCPCGSRWRFSTIGRRP